MNNFDISVYSESYKKLSNVDKYKIVRNKLNNLFNSKEGTKTIGVIYDGNKKRIPYNKSKEYKDLLERKAALEKTLDNDDYTDFDSGTEDVNVLKASSSYDNKKFSEELEKYFEENKSSTIYDTDDIFVVNEDNDRVESDSVNDEQIRKDFSEALNEVFEDKKEPVIEKSSSLVDNDIVDAIPENNSIVNNTIENKQQENIEDTGISMGEEEQKKFSEALNEFFEDKKEPVIEKSSSLVDNDIVDAIPGNNSIVNNTIENKQQENIENVEVVDEEDYSSVWSNVFNKDDKKEMPSINTECVEKEEDYSSVWSNVFSKDDKKEMPPRCCNIDDIEKDDSNCVIINENKSVEKNKNNRGHLVSSLKGIVSFSLFKGLYNKIKDRKRKKIILNPIEERNNKNIKVRTFAYALALAALVTTVLPSFGKNKTNNVNAKKFSISDKHNKVLKENSGSIEENIVYDEPENKETVEEDTGIYFDDVVTISDNAYIYSNSYDAVSETNNLTPIYDGSYERDIMGVVYNLDGKIYTIYSNDSNAYDEAEMLINNGATVEAVLVTRSDISEGHEDVNDAEGYYNVDDVKVKTRIR